MFAGGLELACPAPLISMLARRLPSVVFDCGTQRGEVKRCVRFCDVVGYVFCSVLGLFIWLWFLFWLSLVAFMMFPVGHRACKVKWRVKLQVFATLILGARGRSNIFQHQTAFARCLAVSILFQGGPGIGSTKRIQNRFRLEGAPAVAPYIPGRLVRKLRTD